MTLPSSGAIFGPTPRHASRHGRRCRETGMIERLAVGRRDFVAGAAMLSAAASAGPALAAADNGAGIEAPWTGGGRIVRAGGVLPYRTLGPGPGQPAVLPPKVGGWPPDWPQVAPLIRARPPGCALGLSKGTRQG